MAWAVRKIGELADISRGSSPRPITDTKYSEGGTIPWVKIADATRSGKFIRDTAEHVNEYGASFSRYLPEGTILVAASGVTLGFTTILGIKGCAHDGWLILRNLRGLDRDYAYYFLKTIGQRFHNSSSGAAIQNINTDILRQTEIPLPPLPAQQRFAGILSAYDELIENSQRRIKILEAMARALYREWFIHFRFPGHENHPRIASPLGEIPQGWEVKKLGDLAENFDRMRKPLSKMQRSQLQGAYPYYGAAKVFDYVNDYIFDGEYLLLAEDGSVITPERAPVLQLVNEKFWPNNHTHVLRGKSPFSTHFLYLGLSEVDISPYITGAAQPKITQENMNRIPFFCGPEDLHIEFNRLVEPMIRQSHILQRQIQNLRRTRDLLLPRLLSGQIDVAALPSGEPVASIGNVY